jgi:hypothetical protein
MKMRINLHVLVPVVLLSWATLVFALLLTTAVITSSDASAALHTVTRDGVVADGRKSVAVLMPSRAQRQATERTSASIFANIDIAATIAAAAMIVFGGLATGYGVHAYFITAHRPPALLTKAGARS